MILSVLVPVYNEVNTVGNVIDLLLKEKTDKEIIVINDGSTDGTGEILGHYAKNNLIRLISLPINKGKGFAIRQGIRASKGDIVLIQDADLEYDPRYFTSLILPIISGQTEVVYGTRLATLPFRLWGREKTPLPTHYIANFFLSRLTNLLYGSRLTDMETGYKVFTQKAINSLNLTANRFDIEPEITAKLLRQGHTITEVPISTKPRGYNQGKKIHAPDALIAIWTLIKYRFVT